MTSQTNQIDLDAQLLAFGQAFRHAYARAGLSKHAVAAAVPLDRSAIGKIEKGNRKPQFETVLRLARAAQTTPAALLGGPTNGKREGQASVADAAKRLGENLKSIREAIEPKLTQEELALTANVDRSSVNGYETGREAPSLETIFKLAQTLEVGPWRLLEGVALALDAAQGPKRPGRARRRG